MKDIVQTPDAPAAIGPYSQAVKFGSMLITSGQIPLTPAGELVAGGVAEQTGQVMENLKAVLAAAGTDRTRIVSAQIWLADMADFAEMNAVWDAWVPQGNCPARATGESKLATPDYKVEIIVVAAV